jgi:hypothetical protein
MAYYEAKVFLYIKPLTGLLFSHFWFLDIFKDPFFVFSTKKWLQKHLVIFAEGTVSPTSPTLSRLFLWISLSPSYMLVLCLRTVDLVRT